MGLFDIIADILKDIPTGQVLREKILALKAEIDRLVERNAQLEKEKSDLREKLAGAENELVEVRQTLENFDRFQGMLFLKLPGGGHDEAVYCPSCRHPMSVPSAGVANPFYCQRCKITSGISPAKLKDVLNKLA